MNKPDGHPYQTPDEQLPPTTPATSLARAARRVASTVICTGGIVWCLIAMIVLLELWNDPDQGNHPWVLLLHLAIGAATFVLGLYIRWNQTQHVYLTFLLILLMLVLFPWVAMARF